MELDIQSLFGLYEHSCNHWLRNWDPTTPLSARILAHIRGRYWSAKIDDISLWPPAKPQRYLAYTEDQEHWLTGVTDPSEGGGGLGGCWRVSMTGFHGNDLQKSAISKMWEHDSGHLHARHWTTPPAPVSVVIYEFHVRKRTIEGGEHLRQQLNVFVT